MYSLSSKKMIDLQKHLLNKMTLPLLLDRESNKREELLNKNRRINKEIKDKVTFYLTTTITLKTTLESWKTKRKSKLDLIHNFPNKMSSTQTIISKKFILTKTTFSLIKTNFNRTRNNNNKDSLITFSPKMMWYNLK